MRRLLSSLSAFSLAAVLLTSCGGEGSADRSAASGSGDRTKITFVTMQLSPTFDEYFHGLIEEFEAAHPQAEIDWVDYPYQGYDAKLVATLRSSDPPDVINVSAEKVAGYAGGKLLAPLSGPEREAALQGYAASLVQDGASHDGTPYAYPWYLSTYLCFYNKALLEQAGIAPDAVPTTTSQLPDFARAVKEKTGQWGYYPLYTEDGVLKRYLVQAGVPLIDPRTGKAAFNSPEGVEVLRFWTDLYRDGLVPPDAVTAIHRTALEMYKNGRVATLYLGQEFLRQIEADAPQVYAQTMAAPELTWEGREPRHIVSMHVVGVTTRAEDPELSALWAEFVTNGANQLALCQATPVLPSHQDALNDPFFSQPAEGDLQAGARAVAAKQALQGVIVALPEQGPQLEDIFEDVTEAVLRGEMTPEEALADAEERWNDALGKE